MSDKYRPIPILTFQLFVVVFEPCHLCDTRTKREILVLGRLNQICWVAYAAAFCMLSVTNLLADATWDTIFETGRQLSTRLHPFTLSVAKPNRIMFATMSTVTDIRNYHVVWRLLLPRMFANIYT